MASDNVTSIGWDETISPSEKAFEGALLDLLTDFHGKITYAQASGVMMSVVGKLSILGSTYDFSTEDDDDCLD